MIIIEGLDGTGKTTLKEGLLSYGFRSFHFDYDIVTSNIFDKLCIIDAKIIALFTSIMVRHNGFPTGNT